ncbi:3266_t:CDS:2, partial [Dentiscutata erythropus]
VGLISQLLEAISKFKNISIFNSRQIKKWASAVKATCKYTMLGNGVGAYEVLGQIFNNSNWGVREYKNQQQTWVVLVSQDMNQMQPKIEIQ